VPTTSLPTLAAGSRIVIVRHGEAVSNAEETVAGHDTCKGLTELGRRQMRALAARVEATHELGSAVALYSSILPRAVESAEILAPALGGLEIRQRCELCERHVGEADGMTWADYENTYGSITPLEDPDRELAPGGESLVGFFDRAEAGLYEVMAAHPGELVVVVAHGGVLKASLVRFLGLPANGDGFSAYSHNTSMTEWAWTGLRWWLIRYNDAAHLAPQHAQATTGLWLRPPEWVRLESG
jgi:2,3-bisphosphoglycerate-dependent phosphoglycerate mutase